MSEKYAVIRTGGKQYTVKEGQKLRVEKLSGNVGDQVTLEEVLAIGGGDKDIQLGSPLIDGAKVTGKITSIGKDPKVIIFKKKRRKGFKKTQGHRQLKTEILVEGIS
ncbi:MAG: 50S ribosomal protein L21 [Bdellovibrionales bacterium]|nr:50S ribosomal protein L21 [Bdellovibrionales bacterium]